MPITPFISYSKDRDVLAVVAQALRFHGAAPWRDVESLPAGSRTHDEIEAELGRCHGAILWLSQATLDSDYVMKVEVPLIQRQVERRAFRLLPVFVGMRPSEAIRAVRSRTGIDIGDHNGHTLDSDAAMEEEAAAIVRKYVDAAVNDRAKTVERDPIVRCVTRDDTAARRSEADLNFDLRREHSDGGVPDEATAVKLQQAISSACSAVSASFESPTVDLELKCHLHIGVALGHAFRKPSGRRPRVRVEDETWWDVAMVKQAGADLPALERATSNGEVGSSRTAVLVSLTQDVSNGVNRSVAAGNLRYRRRQMFWPAGGPGQFAVPDAVTANLWAQQVADVMQEERSNGVTDFDVFMAAPIPFAVMLGWRLNAIGPVRLHHWVGNQGPYAPVWTLPAV